jgi:hypothetical protein
MIIFTYFAMRDGSYLDSCDICDVPEDIVDVADDIVRPTATSDADDDGLDVYCRGADFSKCTSCKLYFYVQNLQCQPN